MEQPRVGEHGVDQRPVDAGASGETGRDAVVLESGPRDSMCM